jgi:hypothetical protein
MYNGAQLKSKLSNTLEPDRPQHDRAHRLCYRPAVFFRHLRLITLSFPQGKIAGGGGVLKMLLFQFFLLFQKIV